MANVAKKQRDTLDPLQSARAAMEASLGDFSDEQALREAQAEALALKKAREAANAKRPKT